MESTVTDAQLGASAVRSLMIKGLRRAMLGPELTDVTWPGVDIALKNIDDPSFVAEPFPVGPWCDQHGSEVIHRDPRLVYSIGVLHPVGQADQQYQPPPLDMEGDEEPDPIDEPLPGADDETGTEAESLDPFVNFSKFTSPRSLGFTFRAPESSDPLVIHVSGAWYEKRTIVATNATWWVRHVIDTSVSLPLARREQQFQPEGSPLTLTVGRTTRSHDDGLLTTVWLRNDSRAAQADNESSFILFQAKMSIETPALAPLNSRTVSEPDSLDLLYSSAPLLVTGHGCDVTVENVSDRLLRVTTETMPVVELQPLTPNVKDSSNNSLAIGMQDLADFNERATTGVEHLIRCYREWISDRRAEIKNLDPSFHELAQKHLLACEEFLSDIETGWRLATTKDDVRKCLTLASRAMNQQRRAYGAPLRRVVAGDGDRYSVEGSSPHATQTSQNFWRPFQIAFVLAMIPRFVDRRSADNDLSGKDWVNVIWMPTGGGKTEAYLGLASFVILWERAHITRLGRGDTSSMKVFMRYTYRLLTVQQVSRAASLICALELIRRNDIETFGSKELRIGAWLGSKVTPNSRSDAVKQLNKLLNETRFGERKNFLLSRCPWCGTSMTDTGGKVIGYRSVVVSNATRVLAFCPDTNCEFHIRDVKIGKGPVIQVGLPFLEVDEDIYKGPPDFLVGTIDKTARIPWNPDTQSLFGLNANVSDAHPNKRRAEPPALFIQDELHLIAGPLGSIDGVFEILIEELCKQSGGRSPVYIAATATTKNFEAQAQSLYRRPARLIPPPGLSIDDSFFAKRDDETPGKVYVGVCATGSMSGLDTQTTALGSLAYHAATLGSGRLGANTDPWWSNVVFFSSRRALGLLSAAASTSLGQRIKLFRALSGRRSGPMKDGGPADGYADRGLRRNRELTATSSDDINKVLEDLSLRLPHRDTIDLCMATSMIEVGLDVSRLGLMTVISQPKTASQYIQATGRVGRDSSAPGLVVTVLKSTTPRDLAHYEGFSHWHRRMYASVESASVTPFTRAALERSLPSYMAGMLRMLTVGGSVRASLSRWNEAVDRLLTHIPAHLVDETKNVYEVAQDLLSLAISEQAASYDWDKHCGENEPLMFEAGEEIPPDRIGTPLWRAMSSMRSVDADSLVLPKEHGPTGDGTPDSGSGPKGDGVSPDPAPTADEDDF